MFRKKNKTLMIVTGALIGGAAGSLLTLLFTPKTGKELRTDIKTGVDTSVKNIRESTSKVYNQVKDTTSDTLNRFQTALATGINTYKNETNRVRTSKELIEETLQESDSTHANI